MQNLIRYFVTLLILIPVAGLSQPYLINGKVIDNLTNEPVQYANIWSQYSPSNGTSTDSQGLFSIELTSHSAYLIITSAGYIMDTFAIDRDDELELLIELIPLSESPPNYYYIISGDTILFNHYDQDNGIQCPGTGPKGCKTYCNGQPCEGEIMTYYINDQIYKIANYTNGDIIKGQYKAYYKSGQLNQIGNYKDGHRIGQWLFYSEKGALETIYNYDTFGRLYTEYEFYENGILSNYHYIDYDSACIKSMIGYYKSGKLADHYFEPDCEKDSAIWLEYYQDGTIKSEKMYKSNIEHGNFKYYNNRGDLIREEKYENGKLINTTFYDQ